jgi:hypothetical protein
MRSIADDLRRRTIEQVASLSPEQRIELALMLGDQDLERLVRSSGLSPSAALRRLRASRQRGRRASACAAITSA